jgi:hypothetical protein
MASFQSSKPDMALATGQPELLQNVDDSRSLNTAVEQHDSEVVTVTKSAESDVTSTILTGRKLAFAFIGMMVSYPFPHD